MKNYYNDLGGRMAMLRRKNNITQLELAEMLDISVKHCSAVERGMSNLSLDKLCLLCDILGTSMDYLVRGIEDASSTQIPSYILDIFNSEDSEKKLLLLEYLRLFQKLTENKKTG